MTGTAPTLTLQNNAAMPMLGLGTSPMLGEEAATAVRTALEVGYRLVDTAENYRNEEAVGQGIADSGVARDDIFVTTKFNRAWHRVDGVAEAFRGSISRLGVEYLDMLMVHWPNPDQGQYVDAVRGLARLLGSGDIRAIGVSNFKPSSPAAGDGRDRHRARRQPDPAEPVHTRGARPERSMPSTASSRSPTVRWGRPIPASARIL